MSEEYLRSATLITATEMGYQGNTMGGARPAMSLSGGGAGGQMGGVQTPMMSAGGMPTQPVGTASPQVDGKAFFRQARGKLQHESFNQFLASIKRLNNQEQTREETLAEARRLFGAENNDLYNDFENLLNRQGM